jgi:FkbM family methyltransferase
MSLSTALFREIKSVAQNFGVYVSRFPPPMSKERLLKDFLEQSRINCVLDVGAFIGNYVQELRQLGYQGRIISFEPVPDSFSQMSMNLRSDTAWSGQPYGLSDVNRFATINTYGFGDFNSLLTLKMDAESAFGLDCAMRGNIQIELRRLDEILPALLREIESPRIFLKMDTQGHDASVLRGAAGVLKWIVGMQSEMPAVQLYEGMPSMAQMLDYYRSCGFVPVGLYPVNSLKSKQITPEFDVILNSFDGQLTRTA